MSRPQHVLSLRELTGDQVVELLELATRVKSDATLWRNALAGRSQGLIFQQPSTRTRVACEVGMFQLGGMSVYMTHHDVGLGERERVIDVARTLSRYLDVVVARTFQHRLIEQLAEHASITIINGLSDRVHPCQALADGITLREHVGELAGLPITYVGDGNNVAHSLMWLAARVGLRLTVCTPAGYAPDPAVLESSVVEAEAAGGSVSWSEDPQEAVKGAQAIYTDVWTSMGQETEADVRRREFAAFQVDAKLLGRASSDVKIMHCLPAHRGEEITEDVFESPQSIVFGQAENRMHAHKALLLWLLDAD